MKYTNWLTELLTIPVMLVLAVGIMVGAKAQEVPPMSRQDTEVLATCIYNSEMVFYSAQEKLYNNGSAERLMQALDEGFDGAEYEIREQQFRKLGEWVDSRDFDTAKEYAWTALGECLTDMEWNPSEEAGQFYMHRFMQVLDATEERLFPVDVIDGQIGT